MIGFEAVRKALDACFILEIHNTYVNVLINVVFTQFRLLQVMANAYLHFCSYSRGLGGAGRKSQDTPPSSVAGIEAVNCGKTCFLIYTPLAEFSSRLRPSVHLIRKQGLFVGASVSEPHTILLSYVVPYILSAVI